MKVLSLSVHNFKRIERAEIKPDGSVVILGGDNAQGKSSVLDAIAGAFGGKGAMPSKPIREGADKSEVFIDCGDFKIASEVKKSAKEGGDDVFTLKVTTREGMIVPRPQEWLNERIGKLSFDPLAFTRLAEKEQAEKEQAETLRRLVGVDVSDLDSRRALLYAQRLQTGRDRDAQDGACKVLPQEHLDVPEAELSAGEVLTELTEATELARTVDNLRADAQRLEAEADACDVRAGERRADLYAIETAKQIERSNAEFDRQIDELKVRKLAEATRIQGECEAKKADLKLRIDNNDAKAKASRATAAENLRAADAVKLPDVEAIRAKAANVDATNAKVRANAQRKAAHDKLLTLASKYKAMSDEIATIDSERVKRIAAAVYPIAGLGFGDEGEVTFYAIPLSQASQAEQIRVSMAIAQAMNPQLRVVLVRDASLLDRRSMAMVAEMAEASGTQLWIERVGDGDEGAVIIDDGRVRAKPVQAALI